MDYGRLLIHMLKCTKMHCLNVTHAFVMTIVLAYFLSSRGGSVVDYVLVKECDASIVNTFRVGPLSLDSNHKPLYSHIATKNSHINQCIRAQKEKR